MNKTSDDGNSSDSRSERNNDDNGELAIHQNCQFNNHMIRFNNRGGIAAIGFTGFNGEKFAEVTREALEVIKDHYRAIVDIDIYHNQALYTYRQLFTIYIMCFIFGFFFALVFMRASGSVECGQITEAFLELSSNHTSIKSELQSYIALYETYKVAYENTGQNIGYKANYG